MPFTIADVDKHIKGLDPEQKKQWVNVANSARDKCMSDGGDAKECDASAIRQANGVVSKKSDTVNNFDHPQTFNIDDVEIFAAGLWNGEETTIQDLDDIVSAFDQVGFQPPVKLGHNSQQEDELFTTDGEPALGWVGSIKRVGDKLLADLKELPRALYEALKRGNYKTVSSEIYWNYEQGGKLFPRVLRALALLGADIPAVTSLEAISGLYSDDDSGKYKRYDYTKTAEKQDDGDIKSNKEGGEQMTKENENKEVDVKIYQDNIAELKTKVETFSSENTELKTKLEDTDTKLKTVTAEKDEAKAQLKEFADKAIKEKAERKEADVKAFCDKLVKEGKLLPASKTKVFDSLMNSDTETKIHKFQDANGNTVEQTQFELQKDLYGQVKPIMNFSEVCPQDNNESEPIDNDARAGDILDEKTQTYMAEHNVKDYSEARKSVFKLNPELVKRYNSEASKG